MSDTNNTADNIQKFFDDINNSETELETTLDTNTDGIMGGSSKTFTVRYNLIESNEKSGPETQPHLLKKYELINTTFDKQINKLEKKLKEEKSNITFYVDEHTKKYTDKLDKIGQYLGFINNYKKNPTANKEQANEAFLRNIYLLEGENLRCNEIDYYRTKEGLLCKETFDYKEDSLIKGSVSEIKSPDGTVVGNRYYKDDYSTKGVSNVVESSFINLNFGTKDKTDYKILEIENETTASGKEEKLKHYEGIINNIIENKVRNKDGYEITGTTSLTKGCTAVLKGRTELLAESPTITMGDLLYNQKYDDKTKTYIADPKIFEERLKVYFETNQDGTFKEPKVPKNEFKNKTIVMPVETPGHATVMLIDCSEGKDFKDRIKYFDSSTYACENISSVLKTTNELRPKQEYFGEYAKYIEVLNKNMQINGCCTYWSDCFMKILVEDQFRKPEERQYDTMGKIQEAFNNRSMQLNICVEMSKMFDGGDQTKQTIRKFSGEEDANNNRTYEIFKINSNWYGISKECYKNNFVNFDILINSLDVSNKDILRRTLKEQINLQTTIEVKNSVIKQLNTNLKIQKNVMEIESNIKSDLETISNYINNENSPINKVTDEDLVEFSKRCVKAAEEVIKKLKELYENNFPKTNFFHKNKEEKKTELEEKIKNKKKSWLML